MQCEPAVVHLWVAISVTKRYAYYMKVKSKRVPLFFAVAALAVVFVLIVVLVSLRLSDAVKPV